MQRQPPVVIIGAGRSGTNMLRDILTRQIGYATWPCDEINYIWRHHNRDHPTDQFTTAMATDRVKHYIRNHFDKLASRLQAETVVEKTCANSLRVGFVNAVLPDARFIHIIRDGRDVAFSATQRWRAKLDPGYIYQKAKYVPPTDIIHYGAQYVGNRLKRLMSREGRLSVWGPRFEGMDQVFSEYPTAVACAIQWRVCVETARKQLRDIDPDRQITLRYEDFTRDPKAGMAQVAKFVGMSVDRDQLERSIDAVSTRSVGQGLAKLEPSQLDAIQMHVGDTLADLNYQPAI